MSKNIENLKILAARLAPTIWFRYLTLDWCEITSFSKSEAWENKPTYKSGCDDYGYEWEGWQPEDEDEIFVCMINAENLVGTSMGALPKDTDWSKMIVGNADRE